MSKQAGNNTRRTTVKPAVQKMDAADIANSVKATKDAATIEAELAKAEADKARGKEMIEAGNAVVNSKSHVDVAENNLSNDPFSVYKTVDVDQLTDAAVTAYKEGERSSRREGQMQIANILARYAQDLLQGDYSPLNIYKNDKIQVGTLQGIARVIYCVPEKTMDGKKNPLPQKLLMRVRRIAPIVYHAVTERIPLVWDDDHDALMVPAWLATSDAAMVIVFKENKQARATFSKPVPLDGREGRTIETLLKRVDYPAKLQRPNATGQSNGDKEATALKTGIGNAGLSRSLTVIADMFVKSPNKPFGDDIVELLALCIEHVRTRNGADAVSSAIMAVTGDKKTDKAKAAA